MNMKDFTPEELIANVGVHVRGTLDEHEENPAIKRLTITIYPLPESVIDELQQVIRLAAMKLLTEKKITSGKITDMTAVGPMQ